MVLVLIMLPAMMTRSKPRRRQRGDIEVEIVGLVESNVCGGGHRAAREGVVVVGPVMVLVVAHIEGEGRDHVLEASAAGARGCGGPVGVAAQDDGGYEFDRRLLWAQLAGGTCNV